MNKLIVALDVSSLEEAETIVKELKARVKMFKVGKQLFTATGPAVVEMIKKHGCDVFLDLKFHDIPNTVKKSAEAASKLGVKMFNVHASGAVKMMEAAKEAAGDSMVLGVTVLTSIDQITLNQEMKVLGTVEEQVVHLAELAKTAGLNGVVASPQEIGAIRQACGTDFKIVTPGVRPSWAAKDDQERVLTPREAIVTGADYIVVGRPITQAENKVEAVERILDEIKG